MSTLDKRGREILDQTPVAVGIPFERPADLHVRIRQMLLAIQAEQSETEETFADADDFDMPEDDTMFTPYEMEDDYDHLNDPKWTAPKPSDAGDQVAESPDSGEDAFQTDE